MDVDDLKIRFGYQLYLSGIETMITYFQVTLKEAYQLYLSGIETWFYGRAKVDIS